MKLFVPYVGDQMTLSRDWTFRLIIEKRNSSFIKAMNLPDGINLPQFGGSSHEVTLPAGTVLVLHDYFIRRGKFVHDSRIVFSTEVGGQQCRFWVTLDEVAKIHIVHTD